MHIKFLVWIAVLSVAPMPSWAQSKFNPYLSERFVHDSNVFSFADEQEAQLRNGDQELADNLRLDVLGVDWSRTTNSTTLKLGAEGRRYDYQRFSHLDRDEQSFDANGGWTFADIAGVILDYQYARRMADFNDRDTSTLTLEREHQGGLAFSFLPDALWRFDLGVRTRDLKSPLPTIPEFGLSENSLSAGIRAADGPGLRLGLAGEWVRGKYRGEPDPPSFELTSYSATANYDLDGLTALRGAIGESHRSVRSGAGADISGLTYELALNRHMSSLTQIDIGVSRQFVSYLGGSAAIIEDKFRFIVEWQPRLSLIAYLALEAQSRSFENAEDFPGREDQYHAEAIRVEYKPLQYLVLRPSVAWRKRHSNYKSESFEGFLLSMEVMLIMDTK